MPAAAQSLSLEAESAEVHFALVWSPRPADSWRRGRRWILIKLEPVDARTLQFGPLWVLSALAGTYSRFQSYELAAFWDTVVAVALRTPRPARDILTSMAEDRSGLLLDFELDDRPVVSGLRQILEVLDRMEPETSSDFRLALLRIGAEIARHRGPYGRTITAEHEQLLLLLTELLGMDSESDISGVVV